MTQSQADSLRFTKTGREHGECSVQTLKGLLLRALSNKKHTGINQKVQKIILSQIFILLLGTENVFA